MHTVSVALSIVSGTALAVWGHTSSSGPAFYGGVVLLVIAFSAGALAAHRARERSTLMRVCSASAVLAVNILLGLFLVEISWSVLDAITPLHGEPPRKWAWAYDESNPEGLREWWQQFSNAFRKQPYLMPDPRKLNPYVLKPGSETNNHEAGIRINTLGFRGPEINREKHGAYRIVALGESTTFGVTLLADDRPWPEVLERQIRGDLVCDETVEVVNAGVAGWTLQNQLLRIESDILPLAPDLVVTYHGYNGFHYFFAELPSMVVDRAPAEVERPSRFLAKIESWWQLQRFLKRYEAARARINSVPEIDLDSSAYAGLYRQLATLLKANGIALVVATFNMAVTPESPDEVVRFYEQVFPDVRLRILANRMHSRLVRDIPIGLGVVPIDTSDGLDGAYRDMYIDVVHFTQKGRDRLAHNVLQGILPILAQDPKLRCRPRS